MAILANLGRRLSRAASRAGSTFIRSRRFSGRRSADGLRSSFPPSAIGVDRQTSGCLKSLVRRNLSTDGWECSRSGSASVGGPWRVHDDISSHRKVSRKLQHTAHRIWVRLQNRQYPETRRDSWPVGNQYGVVSSNAAVVGLSIGDNTNRTDLDRASQSVSRS